MLTSPKFSVGRTLKSRYLEIAAWCLMCVLAVVIPTVKIYSSLVIGVLGLVVLVNFSFKKNLSRAMVGLMLMYATLLIGLLFTENEALAHKSLETKLSLIVFPVLWHFGPKHNEKWIQRVLLFFIGATIAYGVFVLGVAWNKYSVSGDASVFTYRKLANGFHPTYQAAYACFSVGTILYWIQRNKLKNHALLLVAALFLASYTALLSSRAGLLSMGALVLFMLFRYSREKHTRRKIWMPAAVLGTFVLVVAFSPGSSSRLEKAVDDTLGNQQEVARSSGNVRFVAWKSAMEILMEKPFGVGTGDVVDALQERYIGKGEVFAAERNINAHNQYLQNGVEHGWWGMLLLIVTCCLALLESYRLHSFLLALLVMLVGFNMLFESFLENQAGIVFFCFMLMLLSQRFPKEKSRPLILKKKST